MSSPEEVFSSTLIVVGRLGLKIGLTALSWDFGVSSGGVSSGLSVFSVSLSEAGAVISVNAYLGPWLLDLIR